MVGATIIRVLYGIEVEAQNDPYVTLASEAMTSLAAVGNAGAYAGMLLALNAGLSTHAVQSTFSHSVSLSGNMAWHSRSESGSKCNS